MHNFRSQNLKFKHFIDDVTIDFLSFRKFCKHERYNKNAM